MKPSYLVSPFLAFVPLCLAGSAHVVNNCGTQLFYASVKNNNNAPMLPLAAGARYTEPFAIANRGVSIKVSPSPIGTVTQFEFTLANTGQIFYDTSNIDGNPFAWNGVSLVPSQPASAAYPSCVTVDCPPGQTCSAAYNRPNDVRTKVCPGTVDLVFTLCTKSKMSVAAAGAGAGGGGGGGGGGPAGAASPSSSGTVSADGPAGTMYAATTAVGLQGKTQGARRPRSIRIV